MRSVVLFAFPVSVFQEGVRWARVMQTKWILFCLEQRETVTHFAVKHKHSPNKLISACSQPGQPGAPPGHSGLINFLERHGLMGVGSGKGEKEKQKPNEI